MEDKISLEIAKQNEKSYKTKRMVLNVSIILIGIIIIGIFITGCVFVDSDGFWGPILLIGAIALGSLYGYIFLYKGIFFKEEKIIKQFLIQQRENYIQKIKTQLIFNLDDKSEEDKLLEKYINLYLQNNAVYYIYGKSLEEQIKFDGLKDKIQDYLDNIAKNLNKQTYCNNLAQEVANYVLSIENNYNPPEYKIICNRKDEWVKFHNKPSETFESAVKYITHDPYKIIATKVQIAQFAKKKYTLNPTNYDKYWDLSQAIRKHNELLEKYTFENYGDYYISEVETTDYLAEYYKVNKTTATNSRYINYCWKCGYPINEDKYNSRRKCSICGGYHCPHCGECLCGFNNKN